MNWINWLRSGSQLLAGMKVTAAFLTYFGIGQVGKWLVEKFYPFTRLLWGDFFAWLKLPDISNLEKDALTAVLFFLPLAISALASHFYANNNHSLSKRDLYSDRATAVLISVIFFLLICGSLLTNFLNFGK